MNTSRQKKILSISISPTNKEYLENIRDTKSINISRYVDELITLDKERNKKK